jgi:hypothetical protein
MTPIREQFDDLAAKLETVWNCPDTDIQMRSSISWTCCKA